MTILVTGGAGYIGSHTCVELLQAGYDIAVLDNFSNSSPEALRRVSEITGKEFPVYAIDLLNLDELDRVFSNHTIQAVIHLAGLKAVGESVSSPMHYYYSNMTSTFHLCETMSKYGVHRFVFSSSATVYGLPESVPITEKFPVGATNPYGRTKQMIEQVLQDLYASNPAWGISILRYFNPIGAHKSGRIGEDPSGIPNNLMPFITQVAIGRRDQLTVYGNDYPTSDGTGVRDYIHVADLAQGHLRALEKCLSAPGLDIYNLGTGKGYSVLDVVRAFEKVSGRTIPYTVVDRRPGDIATCYADPSKAQHELGWKAVRDIEEMCEDSWQWQLRNPEGYKEMVTTSQANGPRGFLVAPSLGV
ncbi:UDP-glucose 4-epimerase GalE [Paenibacillus mendelii]|uniref:UDP-glucose 4-epimerase n=1 Tax=Paenibacillus mendelii TaxID=206163 RepID=A0ABV6JNB2_9BACL|nr:UDP-glucose 4-epimerase GalE [Paenibacillus mendelii]MCQ6558973.1 UDP-glucose 4-epimerase GalE [Paenibacillus mendelii]